MNSYPLQKSISRVFPNKSVATAAELAFLLMLGMLAITLHSKLRMPMHLPGKQGMLFVALVVTGRGLSPLRFAGTAACTGSALLLLTGWLSFHDPYIAITYLMLGGVMDALYYTARRFSERTWVLALASGIAWMLIPFFRLIMSWFVPMPLNMFSSGIAYPFITHLLFGFTGGLLGAGALSLVNRKK